MEAASHWGMWLDRKKGPCSAQHLKGSQNGSSERGLNSPVMKSYTKVGGGGFAVLVQVILNTS